MLKPLDILYDHQVFAFQQFGGVSRIFFELIKNLSLHPHVRISLFHGFYINRFPLAELKNQLAYYFGHPIPPFPCTKKLTRMTNDLFFRLFNPGKKVQLFHPTYYSPTVYRWKKTPLVLSVFDMIPELYPDCFPRTIKQLPIKKKCIKRADHIIAISHTTRNDLLRFYQINPENVSVVYLGTPQPDDSQNTEVSPYPCPYILYIGARKEQYKNFKNLLHAFALVKPLAKPFHLVCFGGGGFTADEIALISRLDLAGQVVQCPGDDLMLSRFYRHASLSVYPSLYEGFGLPPLEAMAYHCPVAVADTPCLKEILGDAAVYFDPLDPASISRSIESLLFNHDLVRILIEKGESQVNKYSWSKMANKIYQVYQELLP